MASSQGRAAVICLGGWGLQTLLHLWPRLCFLQDERHALGLDRQLPNITRLTSFVAVMPEPFVRGDPTRYRPFTLLRPDPERPVGPFYIERASARFNAEPPAGYPELTPGERLGQQLVHQARADGHLVEMAASFPRLGALPVANTRVSHRDMFRMGLNWAEAAARAILHQAVGPTRLDSARPDDTLVQTSIYVVASLAEPCASALLWPLLSELVATLGARNVVNVIGLFATGTLSFGPGDLHVVEEAATYSALVELEALLGTPSRRDSQEPPAPAGRDNRDSLQDELRSLVARHGKPGWERRVGHSLFRRIFLLDREKSNQGLARDSLELAVLAGNAIEAFLSVDGSGYLETHLAADSPAFRDRPYSLIGAAGEYVPIAEYMIAAIREERKRIVRAEFLPEGGRPPVAATLADLRCTPHDAVVSLLQPFRGRILEVLSSPWYVRGRTFALLRSVRGALTRAAFGDSQDHGAAPFPHLPQVRARRDYLLSRRAEHALRELPTLWEWRRAAEERFAAAAARLAESLETTHFENAWGLAYYAPDAAPGDDPVERLNRFQSRTWAARLQKDHRTVPRALHIALRQVVADIAREPAGLLDADARLQAWIDEAEAVAERAPYAADLSDDDWDHYQSLQEHRWEEAFLKLSGQAPHRAAAATRGLLFGLFAAFLIVGAMLNESGRVWETAQLVAAAAGALMVAALLAILPLALYTLRARRLQERRIRLAHARLSRRANEVVRDSLSRVFERLRDDLHLIHAPVAEAVADLERWSQPEESSRIPPEGVEPVYLRQALADGALWERIRVFFREEAVGGSTAQEQMHERWRREGRETRHWAEAGERLAQRVRVALELRLNEREVATALEYGGRDRARHGPGVGEDGAAAEAGVESLRREMRQGSWCAFAKGHSPQGDDGSHHCTACPDPQRFACPFSHDGAIQRAGWTVSQIVRDHADAATAFLVPANRAVPDRPDFVRPLLQEFAAERLLNGNGNGRQSGATWQRYADTLLARAKPSGNYDMSSLGRQTVDIAFAIGAVDPSSALRGAFARSALPILASHDPASLLAVRTVNFLALADLLLFERCRAEYVRLDERDREMIALAPGALDPVPAALAGLVEYEPIFGRQE